MLDPKRVGRNNKDGNENENKKSLYKIGTRKGIDGRILQEMYRPKKPLSEIQKKEKGGASGFRKAMGVKTPENRKAGGDEIKTRAGHGERGPLVREKDPDLVNKEDKGKEDKGMENIL